MRAVVYGIRSRSRNAALPAWVPATQFEAALVPMTNSPGDVESRGVWSSSRVGLGPLLEYSGGVYCPYVGAYGALLVHGGGHSATEDNSVIQANFNSLLWERIGDPVDLGAKFVNYITSPPAIATLKRDSYSYFLQRGPNSTDWDNPEDSAGWESPAFNWGEPLSGIPGSAHTYGKMVMLPPALAGDSMGGLLRPVSSAVGFGWAGGVARGHLFRIQAQTWHRFGANSAITSGGSCTVFDPTRAQVVSFPASSQRTPVLDLETETWADGPFYSTALDSLGDNVFGVFHEQRDGYVLALNQSAAATLTCQFYDGDIAGGSGTRTDASWTNGSGPPSTLGVTPQVTGAGSLMYVDGAVYWYTYAQLDKLYRIDVPANPADPWTWTEIAITGSERPSQMSPLPYYMIYGRMSYAPSLKSIVWVLGRAASPPELGGRVLCIRVKE